MPLEGGFSGRTQKLVDACYAYWQGAVFPIIHTLLAKEGESATPNLIDANMYIVHNMFCRYTYCQYQLAINLLRTYELVNTYRLSNEYPKGNSRLCNYSVILHHWPADRPGGGHCYIRSSDAISQHHTIGMPVMFYDQL